MPRIPGRKLVGRVRQLGQAFNATRKLDSRLVPMVVGTSLATFVVVGGGLFALGWTILSWVFGLVFAILTGMIVFGRRTQSAAIGSIEGKPGAAAAVLQSMRGPWMLTPAVAVTRKQDLVHRVVGRCGVVLVGEGAPARVASLLKQEARRVQRAGGDLAVHEVSVGNAEGQVPLGKLQSHITKLPRAVKTREVGPLNRRLAALSTTDMPIPKGPVPRMPKGPRGKRMG